MAQSQDLRLRQVAALIIEYLLRHPPSVAEDSPSDNQDSSNNGQGGTGNEETTEQEGADSTGVKGDLRRLSDQQSQSDEPQNTEVQDS